MVLLSPFRNGIKRGDQWTLKSLFNNVLFLMDGIHSFSESSELLSFHPCFSVCDLSQLPLSFISFFKSKGIIAYFYGGFCACKYVCMQVCIYAVISALPTSQNSFFNDETFQLYQKYLNIVSQKIYLFVEYGKFGCSLHKNYATLYLMICSKDFL